MAKGIPVRPLAENPFANNFACNKPEIDIPPPMAQVLFINGGSGIIIMNSKIKINN
jgi:hypothetical protein